MTTIYHPLDSKAKLIDPKTVELKHDAAGESSSVTDNDGASTANRPLIHVFNPFHYPTPSSFSPLDYEQWSMLASVRHAKENFIQHQLVLGEGNRQHAFDQVIVICAILEKDAEELPTVLSPYCDRIVHLRRNAAQQYPELELKPLPFIQDIVDVGMEVAKEIVQEREYYLMLTNSDICLTEYFYTNLSDNLLSATGGGDGVKALTINRMTIPNVNIPEIAPGASVGVVHDAAMTLLDQAKQIYQTNSFKGHPGVDCFIAHSSIWDMIQFGDMFLGFPPFDWHIQLAFQIMSPTYKEIASNSQGTFHLGDERSWAHHGDRTFGNYFGSVEAVFELLEWCPRMFNPPIDRHTALNGINCGKLFHPSDLNSAPDFVRPGYEHVYEQAFLSRGGQVGDYNKVFPPCLHYQANVRRCARPAHFLHGSRGTMYRNQLIAKLPAA